MKSSKLIYGSLGVAFLVACVYWVVKGNPFAPDRMPTAIPKNDMDAEGTVNGIAPDMLSMNDYVNRIKTKEATGGWFNKSLFK